MDIPANLLRSAFGEPLPGEWNTLSEEGSTRLYRLSQASPLYTGLLRQHPSWAVWLEEERNLRHEYRYGAFLEEWTVFSASANGTLTDPADYVEQLRRWRRRMSLRIAYRSVNDLASEKTTVEELSRLAEFCVRECFLLAVRQWSRRYGQPWDDDLGRPARFCVVALGKLGGEELNFSSDIDVLFVYEGDGYCRHGERRSQFANIEYFTKLAETLITWVSAQTAAGFLFRVDARLRPEGAYGPLVRSIVSLENYYAVAGQTWERMALLKARPIAGDFALGGELLETLQPFRYPRYPPPSLITEIAATKARTEREIVGSESLDRDVKSGTGGIREIEFVVQAHQVLEAGRYPFLQTHSTTVALEQLARYELIDFPEFKALESAYWFLRKVEHRLQIREEQQTHLLPAEARAKALLANSFGYATADEFDRQLAEVRGMVHRVYTEMFREVPETTSDFAAWWTFFSEKEIPPVVETKLRQWFRGDPAAARELRGFLCGDGSRLVTREQVVAFQSLAQAFDTLMAEIARPAVTLSRLARFAERYSSRTHFFATCSSNPQFVRALALLFDRSEFVFELLCAHPEIFEEVLRPEILRQVKDRAALRRDLEAGPEELEPFSQWLPLYVRAEQVRYLIAELLQFSTVRDLEVALARLADAMWEEVCRRVGGMDRLVLVALGNYGGEELTLGSDLDVIFVTDDEENIALLETRIRRALTLLRAGGAIGPPFAIDTRLRPHGEAGPLVSTLSAFEAYHASTAQLWERQSLTRARRVLGTPDAAGRWEALRSNIVYGRPFARPEIEEMWRMRLRIEQERDIGAPPSRAFKTGPGGLIDHEFLVQGLQLAHGTKYPSLRTPNTRAALDELARLTLVSNADRTLLDENYEFLKRLELIVRRDKNQAISILPPDGSALAHWLGFPSQDAFWADHNKRLTETRATVARLLTVRFD